MSLFQTVKSIIEQHKNQDVSQILEHVHIAVTADIEQDIQPEFNGIAQFYNSRFPSEDGSYVETYMLASALEVLKSDTGAPMSEKLNIAKATLNSHIKDILSVIEYLKHHPEVDSDLSASENARLHELHIHTLNKAWTMLDKAYDRLNTVNWVVNSSLAITK